MTNAILVPTDFSTTAEKAFLYALDIASRSAGTVYIYHVYTPIESPFIETVELQRELNLDSERALMARLHQLRSKWSAQYPSVKIITVLGRSPLVGSVIKFTEDQGINLIVMGTQGASGLKKVIVGTIAARILEKTRVPLLLVPESFEWKQPRKFVLATCYGGTEDVKALESAAELASLYSASIALVHLSETYPDEGDEQRELDHYIARLRSQFPQLSLTAELLPVASIVEGLETLHEQVPYDVLVMIRQQRQFLERLFLEGFTKHMAYLTWKPLLVIPAG